MTGLTPSTKYYYIYGSDVSTSIPRVVPSFSQDTLLHDAHAKAYEERMAES